MKRVLLHIGHRKTATTSIQDTFKCSCSILEEHGYYYPLPDGRAHHNKLFTVLFKRNLQRPEHKNTLLDHSLDISNIEETRSNLENWLIDKLANCRATTIIFSGEDLPYFSKPELEDIKEFFTNALGIVEFAVYAYTRDPIAYASSDYQQHARQFLSGTRILHFPYEEIIGRYLNVFGKESINLYKFEDACKYPGGPVCFLHNKIGLGNEVVDQMQILNKNESISDMAVDLLTYINREIPFTACNLNSGLRRRQDWRIFRDLPGRKFQLPEEDIVNVREKTRSNMIWLKDNFNISYSFNRKSQNNIELEFDDNYVENMIVALRKCNLVIRRLVYDYIKLRGSEANLDIKSKENLFILRAHFEENYFLVKQFTFLQICSSIRIVNYLHRQLRILYRPFRFIYKPLIKRVF